MLNHVIMMMMVICVIFITTAAAAAPADEFGSYGSGSELPQLSINGIKVDSVTDRANEPQYHVKEDAGSIIFWIRLEFLPKNKTNLTIDYFTSEASALDGRDYNSSRATNNTHTFTVVEDSIYVAIPIIDNHRRDGQRFFLFGITSDCGIDIWLQIFIWDDEQVAQLSINGTTVDSVTDRDNEPQYHVKEDAGSITLCIRVESFPEEKDNLTIDYFTSQSTALDGRDYRSTRATNNTHTFTVIGDNIYVKIPILNNRRRDGQRFFLFAIKSECGIDIWLQIFIWDDEQVAQLSINGTTVDSVTDRNNEPQYHVKEDAGSITLCVRVESFPEEKDNLTIDYFTAQSTALDGRDYHSTRATNNTHTFTVIGDNIYVRIPILNNRRRDGQRFFLFVITSDCGIRIWLKVFIWDDEQVAQLSINGTTVDSVTDRNNEPQYHVKEDAGSITLCIRVKSFPEEKDNLTIDYFTSQRTALDGRDYRSTRATNNTHTFTVIGDNIYVKIPILNNRRRDGQRFFLFGITSNCGIRIWLQIFIWDDEQVAQLSINGTTVDSVTDRNNEPQYHVKEDGGSITLCIRVKSFPEEKDNLTIDYFTSQSTALDGRDYRSTRATNNTHTFTVIGDNIYVKIPILNNRHRDGQRFFLFGITSNCGIRIWLQIFIWDDEQVAQLSINGTTVDSVTDRDNEPQYHVKEDAESITLCIRVESFPEEKDNLTIDYYTSQSTALDGRDYRSTRATNNTHTFTVIGDNIYVRIPILNNRHRDSQRFFLFAIKSDCGIDIWLQIFIWDDEQVAQLSINGTTVDSVTDRDNEPQYHVKEDAGSITLCIRVESFPEEKDNLTIDYFTSQSTALDGRDYRSTRATNNTHTFTVIGDNIYVKIPILNNRRRDGQRFFLFGIISNCGINIWLQIFIWDDEQVAQLSINGTTVDSVTDRAKEPQYHVKEDAGSITLCIRVESFPEEKDNLTIDYYTSQSSALDGRDYRSTRATNNTHTFTVIGDNIYVRIPILNNRHRDGQRFFLFGIKSECGINIWLQIFIWDDEQVAQLSINGTKVDSVTDRNNEPQYHVKEDAGSITFCIRLESFPEEKDNLTIKFFTSERTAKDGVDYVASNGIYTFTHIGEYIYVTIKIRDNLRHDGKRFFLFGILSTCGIDIWIQTFIWDDEWEMYGDPHFSVPLLHGGKLCYSVQGIPGLSFNLLSSKHFIINSMFIDSVNDPTQVTWIGKLAVILKSTTKPKPIIFDSVTQSVKIEGNGYFKPQFLQQIVINNTDSITVRATHGLNKQTGNPSVTVLLNNPKASFDVIFHKDHLDVNWKMQDDEIDGCHGLLGQFMVNGIEVDPVKQMLIQPELEPIPVEPSKNWNTDDKCWLAKNVGKQGEGLIRGSIYDYIVATVESIDVSFKKL